MPEVTLIAISIDDMDACSKFYTEDLGFKVADDSWLPNYLELVDDKDTRLLLQKVENPAPPTGYPDAAQVIPNLKVTDAASDLKRLTARGTTVVTNGLQDSPAGPYFAVQDPSGNVIELVQF